MSFFFSSRRRHTSCGRDWSSDVCSSGLLAKHPRFQGTRKRVSSLSFKSSPAAARGFCRPREERRRVFRSEERRVGKECRTRRSRGRYTKTGVVVRVRLAHISYVCCLYLH